jgi:hypothetical protein
LYIFTAGNFARYPPTSALPNLKKCITGSSSTPCITISYAPAGNPEIDAIMAIVARRQGLTIQTNAIMQSDADGNYKNGQEYPSKTLSDIVPVQNSTVLTNFILKYQNVTGVGKSIFHSFNISSASIYCCINLGCISNFTILDLLQHNNWKRRCRNTNDQSTR